MTRKNLLIGLLLMIMAGTAFSLKDAFVKLLDGHYSAVLVVWAQFLFTGLLFLFISLAREGVKVLIPRPFGLQVLRSLFVLSGMGTFYAAISYIPLAEATAMQFIAPLVVTIVAPFVLKERVDLRRIISVIAGFIGVVVIIRPELEGEVLGYIFGASSGFLLGFYFVMNRKLTPHATALATVAYSSCLGAIAITPLVPAVWLLPRPEDLGILGAFLFVAMIGQVCIFSAFYYGEASVVSPFHYFQMVGAILFGYLFFQDFPEPLSLAGIVIIVSSGIYIAVREARTPAG